MFFGSALNNFGIQPFLERFLELMPQPGSAAVEGPIDPVEEPFSGFVFKDPGEHGPGPPRPRRVPAHLLREVRAARPSKHAHRQAGIRLANSTLLLGQAARRSTRRIRATSSVLRSRRVPHRRRCPRRATSFQDFPVFPAEHFMRVELGSSRSARRSARASSSWRGRRGAARHRGRRGLGGADRRRGRTAAVRRAEAPHGEQATRVELRLADAAQSNKILAARHPDLVKQSQRSGRYRTARDGWCPLSESASYLQRLVERARGSGRRDGVSRGDCRGPSGGARSDARRPRLGATAKRRGWSLRRIPASGGSCEAPGVRRGKVPTDVVGIATTGIALRWRASVRVEGTPRRAPLRSCSRCSHPRRYGARSTVRIARRRPGRRRLPACARQAGAPTGCCAAWRARRYGWRAHRRAASRIRRDELPWS